MVKITKFAIFGERCSGTNFLEKSIKSNFNVRLINDFGSKHFFCFNDYSKKNYDDTLFIGIIRNPIYWLNSFSKELYHVPQINRQSLINFLFNKFYSISDQIDVPVGIVDGNIIFNNKRMYLQKDDVNTYDLNYLTGDKYNNIFELRKVKNDYLLNVMPQSVKNYVLINYEDLLFNYNNTLNNIYKKYGLVKLNDEYVKVNQYKKSDKYNFVKQRNITFTPQIINIIWNNLDIEQENKLGYFKYDDNKFFINKNETAIK